MRRGDRVENRDADTMEWQRRATERAVKRSSVEGSQREETQRKGQTGEVSPVQRIPARDNDESAREKEGREDNTRDKARNAVNTDGPAAITPRLVCFTGCSQDVSFVLQSCRTVPPRSRFVSRLPAGLRDSRFFRRRDASRRIFDGRRNRGILDIIIIIYSIRIFEPVSR